MEATRHNVIHYDAARRRLWVAGQRCHHGATGALLTGVAATGLVASKLQLNLVSSLALLATGTALMADDWHDRQIWFERGWQNQP